MYTDIVRMQSSVSLYYLHIHLGTSRIKSKLEEHLHQNEL